MSSIAPTSSSNGVSSSSSARVAASAATPSSTLRRTSHASCQEASTARDGGSRGGGRSLTNVPPPRPRTACRWPLWARAVSAWRSVEREISSRVHSSRSAGSRAPGASKPSLIAVPSRSSVSSKAVWERTGAKTVSKDGSSGESGTWVRISQPFEAADALPVGDGCIVGGQLHVGHVEVVGDDVGAQRLAGDRALGEEAAGLAQRARHVLDVGRGVGVALADRWELDLLIDAVQARGDEPGERQVGVDVTARQTALEAPPRPVADDAEGAGAVVVAPSDGGRRERSRGKALIGVDVGREQQRQLPQPGDRAGQESVEEGVVGGEDVLAGRRVGQREMQVARAALALVVLGHERDRLAMLGGDLLRPILEDDVAVTGRQRIAVVEVDLVLAEVALALGVLHAHARAVHGVADRAQQRLDTRRPEDRVVHVVAVGRRETDIALVPRLL